MKKKNAEEIVGIEENMSFFEKMKNDKKYNAKIQLIGYGVFVVVLIIYLNFTSSGGDFSGNNIMNSSTDGDYLVESEDETPEKLLEELGDNYRYDIVLNIKSQNDQEDNESNIRYVGKSYNNVLEITKEDTIGSILYYKVDNRYYSKSDSGMQFVEENDIYDMVDAEYIELDGILEIIDKASLDHVTDYSSGKKEYVYHLKVRDIIVSYKLEDVVEVKVVEETGVLKISIDYSTLLGVIDESILECELEATITDIGEVEEFLDLETDETSMEE